MNAVAALALALALLAFQLVPGTERAEHAATRSCARGEPVAATPPPDFLFASAEEWKRFALEAELDARR